MNLLEALTAIGALLAIGILAYLNRSMKRRERENTTRWVRRQQSLETELGKLRSSVAELMERLNEYDVHVSYSSPLRGFSSGVNLNRRTEALRMFRRGETPETVAQLLNVPRPEADLLLKVYRTITAVHPPPAKSTGGLGQPQAPARQPGSHAPAKVTFPTISQREANNAATIV